LLFVPPLSTERRFLPVFGVGFGGGRSQCRLVSGWLSLARFLWSEIIVSAEGDLMGAREKSLSVHLTAFFAYCVVGR
jgi:hypothetical protein